MPYLQMGDYPLYALLAVTVGFLVWRIYRAYPINQRAYFERLRKDYHALGSPLTPPEPPVSLPPSERFRVIMPAIITVIVLIAALYIILSQRKLRR